MAFAAVASVARADIIATVEVQGAGGSDIDIAQVNVGSGARTALPAGIDTSADELHPSLSSDGDRLVFQRIDRTAGTNRIIAYEFSTGRIADLFDAFAAQQDQPGTPAISADGLQVLTGRPLEHRDPATPPGVLQPSITRTSLTSFPAGPFGKTQQNLANSFAAFAGRTTQPTQLGGLLAIEIFPSGVIEVTASATGMIREDNVYVGHPALNASVVVFERSPIASSIIITAADLAFRTSDPTRIATAPDAFLPPLVNSSLDESRPAFTADGRYLGFVRHTGDDHDRLFVFDTQTQTLLNPSGVDLGFLPTGSIFPGGVGRRDENLVLRQRPVLTLTSLSTSGILSAQLLRSSGVGILVQRIVGRHRLLGKTVPTLRLVGRVPFGVHRTGRFRTRWDRTVNGRRLRAGRYLVTVRAVTRRGVVRELGRSFVVRV